MVWSPSQAIERVLRVRPRADRAALDPARIVALTHGVGRRLPWSPTCLERALAAGRVLASVAVSGRLVVGVAAAAEGRVDAHAWIEVPGVLTYGGVHAPLKAWPFPAASVE
jgi:hypothetical protein